MMMEDENPQLISDLEKLVQLTFPGVRNPVHSACLLARQFSQEIHAASRPLPNTGQAYAPDQYTLSVHPDDYPHLIPEAAQMRELSAQLKKILQHHGYLLARRPHITFATDPTLARDQKRVIGWHSCDPLSLSQGAFAGTLDIQNRTSGDAFLILNGKHRLSLDKDRSTIGRRTDNDLILDDPHVSRQHAVIELEEGIYFILDCGSKAGTYLNHHKIEKALLQPGDLIQICSYEIVYGEGLHTSPEELFFPPDIRKTGREADCTTPTHLKHPNSTRAGQVDSIRSSRSDQTTHPQPTEPIEPAEDDPQHLPVNRKPGSD